MENQAFWEEKYIQRKHLNRYPFDSVVSLFTGGIYAIGQGGNQYIGNRLRSRK